MKFIQGFFGLLVTASMSLSALTAAADTNPTTTAGTGSTVIAATPKVQTTTPPASPELSLDIQRSFTTQPGPTYPAGSTLVIPVKVTNNTGTTLAKFDPPYADIPLTHDSGLVASIDCDKYVLSVADSTICHVKIGLSPTNTKIKGSVRFN